MTELEYYRQRFYLECSEGFETSQKVRDRIRFCNQYIRLMGHVRRWDRWGRNRIFECGREVNIRNDRP